MNITSGKIELSILERLSFGDSQISWRESCVIIIIRIELESVALGCCMSFKNLLLSQLSG